MNSFRSKYIFIFLLICFFTLPVKSVFAASLYIQPTVTAVSAGNIFTVNILVNTEGKIINNAETTINFPKDYIEVVSIDRSSSIFSLWVDDPSFSNISGEITLNGGIPNPGYTGSAGKVISVVFRAKKSGVASIFFANSAVRENDGLGTDILSTKTGSTINISSSVETPAEQKVQIDTVDSALSVTSSTHPDQTTWYKEGDVELSWVLPKNAQAVKTLLGTRAVSSPTVLYSSPIKSKSIENLSDGIWYFHINYLTANGWSNITHYRIQIDSESPTDVSVNTEKDSGGRLSLSVTASDNLSGIDYYSAQVDSDTPFIFKADSSGVGFSNIPIASIGKHNITIRVYDKAGNFTEKKISVVTDVITQISIDSYPIKVKVGESVEASGTAPYAGAIVSVSLSKEGSTIENYRITADSYSKFNFKSKPIGDSGKYLLWAEILKNDGEIVASSQKVSITATKPVLLSVGSYTVELLKVLIPAVVLLLLFILLLMYSWYKIHKLRYNYKNDFDLMSVRVHKAFKLLSTETEKQLNLLEKSRKKAKLSAEEQDAIEELKNSISQIDLYIETQMKKIQDDDLK